MTSIFTRKVVFDYRQFVAGFRKTLYLLRTQKTDAETMPVSVICYKCISIYKDVDEASRFIITDCTNNPLKVSEVESGIPAFAIKERNNKIIR